MTLVLKTLIDFSYKKKLKIIIQAHRYFRITILYN